MLLSGSMMLPALLFFFKDQVGVIIGGIILMTGYLVSTSVLGAKIRDYTPEKETGLFQGVRMVFFVMVPFIIGPVVGQNVSRINGKYALNEYGQLSVLPNEYIFLFAIIFIALAIIPIIYLIKEEKKDAK